MIQLAVMNSYEKQPTFVIVIGGYCKMGEAGLVGISMDRDGYLVGG